MKIFCFGGINWFSVKYKEKWNNPWNVHMLMISVHILHTLQLFKFDEYVAKLVQKQIAQVKKKIIINLRIRIDINNNRQTKTGNSNLIFITPIKKVLSILFLMNEIFILEIIGFSLKMNKLENVWFYRNHNFVFGAHFLHYR